MVRQFEQANSLRQAVASQFAELADPQHFLNFLPLPQGHLLCFVVANKHGEHRDETSNLREAGASEEGCDLL